MRESKNRNGNRGRREEQARGRRRTGVLLAAVEPLECRFMMSFYAGLSAVDGPIVVNQNFTLTAATDGSVTPSSETFNFGNGSLGPYSNPGTFKQATSSYGPVNPPQTQTFSPTLSVTPTGGSAQTVPLTLDSNSGVSPTYSGKSAAPAYGNTYSSGGGTAMAIDLGAATHSIYVAAPYNDGSRSYPEISVTRFTPAGAVDTGWGPNNGTSVFSFDSTSNIPYAMLVDSNYIYIAGVANGKFCVARLNTSDGSLDTSFGASLTGKVTLSQTGQVKGMTIEAHNASRFLVLVGPDGTGTKMAIARLTTSANGSIPAGSLDSTFGPNSNGMETLSPAGGTESANFVMQADFTNTSTSSQYDLLVGGFAQFSNPGSPSGSSCNSMVLALTDCQAGTTNAGVLDTANFGYNWVSGTGGAGYTDANISCIASGHAINGCRGTGYGSNDNVYSLVCWTNANITPPPTNPAWSIYSVGPTDYTTANPNCSNQFSFVRYTQNGVRDTTWGTQGVVAIGSGPAGPNSLAIPYGASIETLSANYTGDPEGDPNALIVAAGSGTYSSTGCDFILTRISVVDGSLDGTFGSSGQTYTDMTPSGTVAKNDVAKSVLIDYTDFDIVVGGSTSYSTGQLAVARYRPNNTITVNAAGGAPRAAAQTALAFSPRILSLARAGPRRPPMAAPATVSTDPLTATYEDPLLLGYGRRLRHRIALRVPG